MTVNAPKEGPLKDAVIRICLKCGVVNPAGPSETCPHLQLARFNGVDETFATLLSEVALARTRFDELLRTLKNEVKRSLREHEAELETPRRTEPVGALPQKTGPLALESPKHPGTPPPRRSTRPSRKPAPVADPRQLELLVRQPPKGHA